MKFGCVKPAILLRSTTQSCIWTFLFNRQKIVKMPLPLDSPIVCQIPDCTTTQLEIELELKTYLSSYCTFCKQVTYRLNTANRTFCTYIEKVQMLYKDIEYLALWLVEILILGFLIWSFTAFATFPFFLLNNNETYKEIL